MKKSFFFAALMMVAAMFTACNSGGTPMDDTTKLWPAADAEGKSWGYIDNSGNLANAMYERTYNYSCGYGCAELGNLTVFLDTKGKVVQGPTDLSYGSDRYFYFNYCCFRTKNGTWGLMDKDLKTVIQPAYGWLGYMSSVGLIAARKDGSEKYGFLNKDGEWAIDPKFESASMFEDGVAVVSPGNDKFGAIDTKGQFQIDAKYDGLESIGENCLVYWDAKTEKVGMMDTKGNIILQAMYDDCRMFADNGLCPFKKDGDWGYIDKNGNMKISFDFYRAYPFYEGYAWIKRTEDSNYELIDTEGKNVLTLGDDEYPNSVYFHNGLCLITEETQKAITYKYIDTKGKMVYSWSYKYEYAPARVAAEEELNIAEMFAGTPYGYRFNKK